MIEGDLSGIKGVDISSLEEVEKLGGRFYENGIQRDALEIMKNKGVNYVRLRLWNCPYSMDGKPYGAGNNDLSVVVRLAKRAQRMGMGFLLDFHYSDFWADPGKQCIPKAWLPYQTVKQLEQAVFDYTRDSLLYLVTCGVCPTMVQVGNEVTNGLLWPFGKKPEYQNIAIFISAGIRAVRQVLPDIPVMLHLDDGGNNEMYRDWFDHYLRYGEDFECIGLSYYPFWHGTMAQLEYNMKDMILQYGKDLIIAEVSMGFTMQDYEEYEKLGNRKRKGMATKPELVSGIEYEMSMEGQCKFLRDLLELLDRIPENRGRGFFYWEPAWIPVPGSEWATPEAISYMKEKSGGGNEWANQALFDYDGNALPSWDVIHNWRR